MGIVITCIAILLTIHFLKKFKNKKEIEKLNKENKKELYRKNVLEKLETIQNNTNQYAPEKSLTEKFLEVNKEIMRKRELQKAIKEELGVE